MERCLEETGAVGVMTAEGNLYNPALFLGQNPPAWIPAKEYLDLADKYPCPLSYVRGHLFKLFHHMYVEISIFIFTSNQFNRCSLSIPSNNNLRIRLGAANTMNQFRIIIDEIRDMYEPYHEGLKLWEHSTDNYSQNIALPPWLCQPYVRDTPEDHIKKVEDKKKEAEQREVYNLIIVVC